MSSTHAEASGSPALLADRGRPISALRLVASPRVPQRIAKVLLGALALTLIALLFAPWQQSVKGGGQVVAYAPLERQQTVQANISGRVHTWDESIREGSKVVRGQRILELRDIDPAALERLETQRDATKGKLEATEMKLQAYRASLTAITEAQRMAIEAARQEVSQAQQKVEAEQQGVIAAEAAELQAKAYLSRQKRLLAEKLKSVQEIEIAERKYTESLTKLRQARDYLTSAEHGLSAKRSQLIQKEHEAESYIQKAQAELQSAIGEVSLAQKELAEISGKLAKQQSQVITAPRDGTIVRLLVNQGGEIVKSGDPLFVLVPENASRAVELLVSGNDAPLVSVGRHVRLQFEGWPAVQFAGWPSVAVGTFGGEVVNIDATDDGKGKFRLLVLPAEGETWPDRRYLRQGVRANGWVLLDQVTLGYEAWRQINGFPPVVSAPEPKESKDEKPPKVKM